MNPMPQRLVVLLVILLLVAPTMVAAAPLRFSATASTDDRVPGRIVIGLRTSDARTITSFQSQMRSRFAAGAQDRMIQPNVLALQVTPQDAAAVLAQLRADPRVAYAEPEYRLHALRTPNDALYAQQWALPRIGAPAAWDTTTGVADTIVAVIDSGVDAAHPDLAGRVLPGYDFINSDADASDDNGHGTFTAGIIAGAGDNGIGVAGVCWQCRILPVKAINAEGDGTSVTIALGVRWAVDHGARVINMSLGGDRNPQVLRSAIAYAESKGALVVAAAGNEAQVGNPTEYPAGYDSVLAIGATDQQDAHAPFSNFGSYVDLAAPGVGILSTIPGGYRAEDGTSTAAPFVAGVAGLLVSLNPALRADQLRQILMNSADDVGSPGRDEYTGAGRLNAARAVQAVTSGPPTDARTFAETGKTLRGEFRRFWEANGGLPVFGYPISDEVQEQTPEGTITVQYFERNRFEFHPEKPAPYNVLLGRLGDTLLTRRGVNWQQEPPVQPAPGCRFFAQTGHNVCEPFLSYWRSHGLRDPQLGSDARSLALFGLPLGEARIETNAAGDTVLTQWFERARLEDHGAKGVLLGLLGDELQTPVPATPPASTSCPGVPPLRDAQIVPGQCVAAGTELRANLVGFTSGETITSWLTGPNNAVQAGVAPLVADAAGQVREVKLETTSLTPGLWFWVFQGVASSHQSVVYIIVK